MVNSGGQLFTIEGIAAGLIMLLTAFIVVSTTSIYTPGDTHISDMQLEQLGSDALRMMNTPNTSSPNSTLQNIVKNYDMDQFRQTFLWHCNSTTGGTYDNLQFSADIYYRNRPTTTVNSIHFTQSRNLTGGEHAVRVTEWVQLNGRGSLPIGLPVNENQTVLVEVLLWRD
jgi:hypothetical protein